MPSQKKEKTTTRIHVGLVMDRSGSMGSVWPEAIEALNDYTEGLKADEDADTTFFSLLVFDTQHDIIHDDSPAARVEPFNGTEFPPRGSTALNDAIARMIIQLEDKVAEDEKAMVVVLTDGMENASIEYSEHNSDGRARLAKVVKTYEDRGNWTFVWLGANDPNVHANAQTYGVTAGNVAAYSSTSEGYESVGQTLSSVTSGRKHAASMRSGSSFEDAGVSQDIRTPDDQPEPEPPKPPERKKPTITRGGISDYLS